MSPAAENTFRSSPWQPGHVVSASSLNDWTTSRCSPHERHAYSYVGIRSLLHRVRAPARRTLVNMCVQLWPVGHDVPATERAGTVPMRVQMMPQTRRSRNQACSGPAQVRSGAPLFRCDDALFGHDRVHAHVVDCGGNHIDYLAGIRDANPGRSKPWKQPVVVALALPQTVA